MADDGGGQLAAEDNLPAGPVAAVQEQAAVVDPLRRNGQAVGLHAG